MLENLLLTELLAAIALVGGAVGIIVKLVSPALKLGKTVEELSERVRLLERHNGAQMKDIERVERANKLFCKAMIALLDNWITDDNNIDDMKIIKAELMEFLTEGLQ